MPRYRVLKDYRSGTAGPFFAGDIVNLEADLAEWVERDSSGTLRKIRVRKKRQTKKPPQDRMVKAREDRGAQEPITKADYQAVRD